MSRKETEYSDRYEDGTYEYRHVILTVEQEKQLPRVNKVPRLLTENEWRALGVQQSRGWVHFEIHRPEPHVLMFRRPLGTDPLTGKVETSSNTTPPKAEATTTTNPPPQVTRAPMQPVAANPSAVSSAAVACSSSTSSATQPTQKEEAATRCNCL
jgi:cyclin-dependent kinase regulatory subunit CKS1